MDEFLHNKESQHWQLSISRFGVSNALQADFSMLREVQGAHGANKFSRKSVDTLAQIIVCRNYGNACYELAHLYWAVIAFKSPIKPQDKPRKQNPLLEYFWIDQIASKQQFVAYFTLQNGIDNNVKQAQQTLRLTNDQLCLHINGHDFVVNASRANFLSCLMEWLIGFVPDLLGGIENSLIGKGQNAINELASHLQQKIYAYLSDHLPPAKLQRRYRDIANWYAKNAIKPNCGMNKTPSDSGIFKFWTENNKVEGFTKYSNVFCDHIAYLQAQEVVLTEAQLAFANSLEWHSPQSNSAEFGGLHSSAFDTSALNDSALYDNVGVNENALELNNLFEQFLSPEIIDLSLISQRPKVLNQSQVEMAEYIALYPNTIGQFSLSWLRVQVFGKYQNQLIQAKRSGKNLSIETLVANPKDFLSAYQASAKIIANNQQSLLAIINILLARNSKEALGLLATLMQQVPSMQENLKRFRHLLQGVEETFSQTHLSSWQLKYPWFKEIINQSKLARKKINRQGFSENTLLSEDEYLVAAGHLFSLNRALNSLLKAINQNKYQQSEKFEADRFIFINELSRIYCQDGQ